MKIALCIPPHPFQAWFHYTYTLCIVRREKIQNISTFLWVWYISFPFLAGKRLSIHLSFCLFVRVSIYLSSRVSNHLSFYFLSLVLLQNIELIRKIYILPPIPGSVQKYTAFRIRIHPQISEIEIFL